MKTITIEGKIVIDWLEEYTKFFLEKDGYKTDIVGRVQEITASYPNMQIQVAYYVSKEEKNREQMLESFLEKVLGKQIEAGYEDRGGMGSEYTGWMPSPETDLMFGCHDFTKILYEKEGYYMAIDFNIT